MDFRTIGAALGMALLVLSSSSAAASSSSCDRPISRVERLVCASPDVRRLDAELGQLYDAIESETRGIDGETGRVADPFGEEHEHWLVHVRNRCDTDACLKTAYQARIAYVRQHWGSSLED